MYKYVMYVRIHVCDVDRFIFIYVALCIQFI